MIVVVRNAPWLVPAGLVVSGLIVAGGGYALRAATAEYFDPFAAPAQSASPDDGEAGGGDAGQEAPLGNDAQLTYTRLDGASYLRVVDGRPVARITPTAAESGGDGVTLTFEGEYLADNGELVLEPGQFFHYAHPGTPQTGDVVEQQTVFAVGDSPLATLSPGAAEQEFSVTLPGAPEAGAVSYFAETDEQQDPYYRLPICYEAGDGFTSEREQCEEVAEPFSPGS